MFGKIIENSVPIGDSEMPYIVFGKGKNSW